MLEDVRLCAGNLYCRLLCRNVMRYCARKRCDCLRHNNRLCNEGYLLVLESRRGDCKLEDICLGAGDLYRSLICYGKICSGLAVGCNSLGNNDGCGRKGNLLVCKNSCGCSMLEDICLSGGDEYGAICRNNCMRDRTRHRSGSLGNNDRLCHERNMLICKSGRNNRVFNNGCTNLNNSILIRRGINSNRYTLNEGNGVGLRQCSLLHRLLRSDLADMRIGKNSSANIIFINLGCGRYKGTGGGSCISVNICERRGDGSLSNRYGFNVFCNVSILNGSITYVLIHIRMLTILFGSLNEGTVTGLVKVCLFPFESRLMRLECHIHLTLGDRSTLNCLKNSIINISTHPVCIRIGAHIHGCNGIDRLFCNNKSLKTANRLNRLELAEYSRRRL